MMNRSILVLFIGCILGMPAAFWCGKYFMGLVADWRGTHFTCDTSLMVNKPGSELALKMSFFIEGNNGVVIYKGSLKKDGQRYNISRKNYFIIQRTKKLFRLTSTSGHSMPGDNVQLEDLRPMLPFFYVNHDTTTPINIYSEGGDGYVFSTDSVPSFYCRKI